MKNCILEGNLAFKTTNSYYKYCFDHCVFKNSIGDFSTAFVTMASMSYAWFKNCYLYESFENLFQGTGIATHCNIINSYLYISESSSSSSSYVLISNTDEYGGTTNVEIINSYIQGCNLGITDRIDCFGYWSSFCKVGDYSKMPNKTTCVEAELKVPPTDFFLLSKVKTENKA